MGLGQLERAVYEVHVVHPWRPAAVADARIFDYYVSEVRSIEHDNLRLNY